jgi:hypothetical protein
MSIHQIIRARHIRYSVRYSNKKRGTQKKIVKPCAGGPDVLSTHVLHAVDGINKTFPAYQNVNVVFSNFPPGVPAGYGFLYPPRCVYKVNTNVVSPVFF